MANENFENDEYPEPEFNSWIMRALFQISPRLVFFILKIANRNLFETAEKLHSALSQSQRIDFFPVNSGTRGFRIIIDQKTALYFSQDGDKFSYDGWEAGDYKEEKGDVTIFDGLKGDCIKRG